MNINKKLFLCKYGSKDHLVRFVNDIEWRVRASVAKNPNTTKEHLDKLVNDRDSLVRYNVAGNCNSTSYHLNKLVNDEDFFVSSIARNRLNGNI